MRELKYLLFILAIPVIGGVGYAVMHGLFHIVPLKGHDMLALLVTLVIIGLGLAIPYLMLKSGFKGAQVNDPGQKPLEMKDLPKDQRQLKDHV